MTDKDRAALDECFAVLECRIVVLDAEVAQMSAEMGALKEVLIALRRKPGLTADELAARWNTLSKAAFARRQKRYARMLQTALRASRRARLRRPLTS
jgi:hypothetical protein